MKRFSSLMLAVVVAVVGLFVAPKSAEAIPSFARQVGVGCDACHFQHLPKLNAFGREFKIGGFTQASQDLIEDDGLSIPAVANVSMVYKWRYKKTSTKDKPAAGEVAVGTDRGQLDLPDEAALFIGGRVGDNFGFLTEGANKDATNKFIFSKDFGGFQGGATVFSTDAGGASYGMELMNNAHRFNRGWENRTETIAAFAIDGPAQGTASGIGVFGGNELFFANFTLWGPAQKSIDTNFDLSTYVRFIITPKVWDGVDLMIGYQGTSGKTKCGTKCGGTVTALKEYKTESTAIDFQAQIEDINGMTLDITGTYQTNPKNTIYNASTTDSEDAFSLGASLGFAHTGIKAALLQINNENGATAADSTTTSIGGWWNVRQNVELIAEYSAYSGDGRGHDNYMILMLEFAI